MGVQIQICDITNVYDRRRLLDDDKAVIRTVLSLCHMTGRFSPRDSLP